MGREKAVGNSFWDLNILNYNKVNRYNGSKNFNANNKFKSILLASVFENLL